MRKTRLTVAAMITVSAIQAQDTAFKAYDQLIPGTSISFKMTPIPEGSFLMGSNNNERGRDSDEGPQRHISISPFWMGVHEVTYDEYLSYYNDESVSVNSDVDAVTRPTSQYIDLSWGMGKQGGFPFNSMSQLTALTYCRWLYKKTGIFYRLPTEAEWEYACRAGTSTAYFFGDNPKDLGEYAWFSGNSKKKYHKTGEKKPNPWGLYDMLGNLSEWTLDQYDADYFSKTPENTKDPVMNPVSRYPKTVKGGGYTDDKAALRCAARTGSDPGWNRRDPQIPKSKWWLTDATSVGFRIVRPLKQPAPEEAEAFYKQFTGK